MGWGSTMVTCRERVEMGVVKGLLSCVLGQAMELKGSIHTPTAIWVVNVHMGTLVLNDS